MRHAARVGANGSLSASKEIAMSIIQENRVALASFAELHPAGDRHAVTAQNLDPSGDLVSISIFMPGDGRSRQL
jgi:hypothetical protein